MASVVDSTVVPGWLRFFMLTPSMCEQTEDVLHAFVEEPCAEIDIIDVDVKAFQGLQVGRFGTDTLLRLIIHRYHPDD